MNKRSESAKGATTLHTAAVDWKMRPSRNQPGLVRLGGSSIAILLALFICVLARPGSARADAAACKQACARAYEACLGSNWPGLDKIAYCVYESGVCWRACPPDPGPGGGPAAGGGPGCGEPVDTGTGIFTYEHTDLSLADVIPLTLTHTYRAQDTGSRAFGIGVSDNYDMTLYVDTGGSYTYADLILADASDIHYVRTSSGTSYLDAVFQNTSSPTPFQGSTIIWTGDAWLLSMKDGTQLVFGAGSLLDSITDRNGNTLSIPTTTCFGWRFFFLPRELHRIFRL
jgi:hypothetical protein